MNQITTATQNDKALVSVMSNSLYPGARPESVEMVLSYCRARGLDPMLKPVHIVPMWVIDAITKQGAMRDVPMPGIGLYRIQAARTGTYAGKSEPEFGPDVTDTLGSVSVTYPKLCKVTVQRMVAGQERAYTATEFWLENYATKDRNSEAPNAMWKKRAYGQLAKCAEAQALRMAFPEETGGEPTAEEMDGKSFAGVTLEGKAEPARQQQTTADVINDSIPHLDAPPKLSLTEMIHQRLKAATNVQEVIAVGDSPEVRRIMERAPKDKQDEVNAMLADAYQRHQSQQDGDVPNLDDDFPGDRSAA